MNYYDEIKNELINNEINRKVKNYLINRSDLNTYYIVGKMLSEAGKNYGENIINEYVKKLKSDINKKYNERNISYRKLSKLIKDNDYSRINEKTKAKIKNKQLLDIKDLIKNPIKIRSNNYDILSEKLLQKLIIEKLNEFLVELGNGFCFVSNEYKIIMGDRYNYIDLLLFNIEYNCYVVIELKVIELKKEHIGQIQVYMNYIDKNIKKFNQNKTIGIIICKKENKFVIEYCSDERITVREYELV